MVDFGLAPHIFTHLQFLARPTSSNISDPIAAVPPTPIKEGVNMSSTRPDREGNVSVLFVCAHTEAGSHKAIAATLIISILKKLVTSG